MNRPISVFAFVLFLFTSPFSTWAEGAGGLEFSQVVGRDLWAFPGGSSLPASTGLVSSFGGIGYGVQDDGTVSGGFGMAVTSRNLSIEAPTGAMANGFTAGYGGVLQGWQHRWGPLVGMVTTKIGFGGANWSTGSGWNFTSDHVAGFSVLGAAEAQVGALVLPWFTLGVTGGVAGTITFVAGQPFLVAYAPTIGLRLLWGSF